MPNPKKIVIYDSGLGTANLEVGRRAIIYPVTHPSNLVDNTTYAITSTVVRVYGKVFETANTIYAPLNSKQAHNLRAILGER